MPGTDLTLYLLATAGRTRGRPLPAVVGAAVAGGVTAVLLRGQGLADGDLYALGLAVQAACRRHRVPYLVYGRADLALLLEADGVHLGPEDLPVPAARRLLGPERLIGASVETEDQARAALADGANYLLAGPVYTTPDYPGEPFGPDLVRRMRAAALAHALETGATGPCPVVGVGGIHAGNASPVIAAGADGLAVGSAILTADDPQATAAILRRVAAEWR